MTMRTDVIERLFSRMAATYGAAWERSMGSVPLADVKAVWAHELAGFSSLLDDIAWALEHLPERCPNVIEFKALCRQAPRREVLQLTSPPPASPHRMAAAVQQIKGAMAAGATCDPKQWARDIVAAAQAGKPVSGLRLRFAREALRGEA